MEENLPYSLEQTLAALASTRERLEKLEALWKAERLISRRLTMSLVQDHGYSIQKASKLSGHNRQTIKVWADAGKPWQDRF